LKELIKTSLLVVFCFVFLSLAMSGITNQNQTIPYISEPDDLFYTEGVTGNYIEWYVSFDTPLHYSIQRNNTALNMGGGDLGSNSGNITICVDGLSVGTWYYLLIVDDYGENVATDLVIVTVNPSVPPILLLVLSVILLISAILVLSVWRIKKS
jgi:hypothetical protein